MKTHKVVTRNIRDTYTVMFEGSRSECRAFIVGRWGHWPPFAAVTTIGRNNYESLF